jgi:hypothetical protein
LRLERGGWRLRLEAGESRLEARGSRFEGSRLEAWRLDAKTRGSRLEAGGWSWEAGVEAGAWRQEGGGWRLEAGGWRLEARG